MDTPLSDISRVEYIHTDDHLLTAMRRYKGLRTYPGASDRSQVALHAQVEKLAAKGLVRRVRTEGASVLWQSAV